MNEHAKGALDLTSLGTIILALFDQMPKIAALVACIWTLIRIWETKTVQGWVAKIRKKT